MKKVIIIAVIMIVAATLIYFRAWESKCKKLYREYYGSTVTMEDSKRMELAYACLYEKPEVSIMIFKHRIDEVNGPQFVYGQRFKRMPEQVRLVAAYYRSLAIAYERKGYDGYKKEALEMAEKYEQEATRLK